MHRQRKQKIFYIHSFLLFRPSCPPSMGKMQKDADWFLPTFSTISLLQRYSRYFYNPSKLSFPMFSPMLKSFCCFIYQGCGCHMVGSISPTCSTNGRCRCKPGFGGYKCDRCISSTYYGFPNCKRKWIFLLRWLKHSIVSTVDF